jgi:hypothetical protein
LASSDSPAALIDGVADWDSIADLDGSFAGYSNVKLQISLSQDNGATWSAWADFYPGPYKAWAYKLRAELTSISSGITAVLPAFDFTVDMPDLLQSFTNQAIAMGGTALVFPKPCQIVPNIQVSILNAQQGDTPVYLVQPTKTGLTLQIQNGGVGVARNVNVFVQSY